VVHPVLVRFALTGPLGRVSSDAELAAAEELIGMSVPDSYRELATSLGWGRFFPGVGLLLYVPFDDVPDALGVRAPEKGEFFVECLDDGLWEFEPDGSEDLVRRLVPFGISENSHFFAWDPTDPCGLGECWIYSIGRMLSVTKAAPDVFTLLDACTDERVKRVLGPGYKPLAPVFEPWVPNPW
jgi:hypothetical protein